jgi:hypothetical protein
MLERRELKNQLESKGTFKLVGIKLEVSKSKN